MRILIFLSILLVLESCSSLEDIHRDKVEFVKSLIGNSDTCLIKIKQSKYYKVGITNLSSEVCCGLQGRLNNFGIENLKIEVVIPKIKVNEYKIIYVEVKDPKDQHRIIFEFLYKDSNEYILKEAFIGIMY